LTLLASVFRLGLIGRRAQIGAQGAREELEEHLEADAGDGRVVATFAQLISDEGIWPA
jgi:hypothetical protein